MSNDDNNSNSNSNSNSRGDEDDADDYTFDCIIAPYGRSCVSVDRQEKREIVSYIHSILVTILISSLESTMASISHLRVVCLFLLLLSFKGSSQENV